MRADAAALAIASAALIAVAIAAGADGADGQEPTSSAAVRTTEAAEIAALPDDPSKTLVTERCLPCHGAGLIAQQHKDAAAWDRTVTQMRTWGTPLQPENQTAIVAYLSKHFGPRMPAVPPR
jgi:cytochrome c5